MSDEAGQKGAEPNRVDDSGSSERLEGLKAELFKHFGKLTRWKVLCQERDATTDEAKIRLAAEILAAPSTGTVAEWHSYHLRLRGKKSFNVDEYLARRAEDDRRSIAETAGDGASSLAPDQDGA